MTFFGRFWGARYFGRPYWGPAADADSAATAGALAEDEEDILLMSVIVSVTD